MGCDRPGGQDQDQQLGFYLGSRMEITEALRWQNIKSSQIGTQKVNSDANYKSWFRGGGIWNLKKKVTRFGVIAEMWMR